MAIIAVAGRKVEWVSPRLSAIWRRSSPPWAAASLSSMPTRSTAWWPGRAGRRHAVTVRREGGCPSTLRARARKADEDTDIVLIDTPPGMPEVAYQAALAADLMLLPCGPSRSICSLSRKLYRWRSKRAPNAARKNRASVSCRRSADVYQPQPRTGFIAERDGEKSAAAIGQRVVVAEAVSQGLTVAEYAPDSPARAEFSALAKAVDKILRK